ncbi:hypothetical protein V8E36_004495 [Tilletia maclaganii]
MDGSTSSPQHASLFGLYAGTSASTSGSGVGSSSDAAPGSSRALFRSFLPPTAATPLPTVDNIPPLDELLALQSALTKLKQRAGQAKDATRQTREAARVRRDALRTRAEQETADLERAEANATARAVKAEAGTDLEEGQIADDDDPSRLSQDALSPTVQSKASSSKPASSVGPSAATPAAASANTKSPSVASEPFAASSALHSRSASKDSTSSASRAPAAPISIADLPKIPLKPVQPEESKPAPTETGASSQSSHVESTSRPQPTSVASPPADFAATARPTAPGLGSMTIGSGGTSPLTEGPSTTASPSLRSNATFEPEVHAAKSPALIASALSAAANAEKNKKRKRDSSSTPAPAGTGTTEIHKRARSGTGESSHPVLARDAAETSSSTPAPSVVAVEAKDSAAASQAVPSSKTTATATAPAPTPRLAVKLKLNPASRNHFQAAAAAAAARAATSAAGTSSSSSTSGAGPSTPGPSTATAHAGPIGRRGSTPAVVAGLAPLSQQQLRPGSIGPDGRMVDFPPHAEEPPSLSWALPVRTPSSIIPKRPVPNPPRPYARRPEDVQIDWTRWDWKAGVLGMNPQLGPLVRGGTPALGADDSMGGTPGPSASGTGAAAANDGAGRAQATRKDRKGKEIQQTPIVTFYQYTDAFFKTLTEDDLAWLSGETADLEPFQMPALGRYYREVWAEDDATMMAAAAAAGYDIRSFDSGSWNNNARGRTGSTPSGFFGTPGPDDSFGKRGLGISGGAGGAGNSARRRTRSATTLGGLVGGGTGGVYSNTRAVHFTPAQMRDGHLFQDEEAKGGPLTERIVSALMPVAEEEGEAEGAGEVGAASGTAVAEGSTAPSADAPMGEARPSERTTEGSAPAAEAESTPSGLVGSAEMAPAPSSASSQAAADASIPASSNPARPSSPLKMTLKPEPGTDGDTADPEMEGDGDPDTDVERPPVGGANALGRRPRPQDKAAQEQDLASFESRLALELRAISVLSPTEAGSAAAAAAASAKELAAAHARRADEDTDQGEADADADGEGDDEDPGDGSGARSGSARKSGKTSLPFFDPTLRTDDEISSALRQTQRALREQMTINAARKKRLFEIAHDRMAYQDYANALSSVEKDVEQHWYKRQKQLKTRREREKEREAAGGSSARGRVGRPSGGGPLTHAEIAAAAIQAGYSSSSSSDSPSLSASSLPTAAGIFATLPEPLAAALERRQKLKYAFDPLFKDVCPHSWKTPEQSVFADLRIGGQPAANGNGNGSGSGAGNGGDGGAGKVAADGVADGEAAVGPTASVPTTTSGAAESSQVVASTSTR